jgi:hypothetical protein
MNLPNARHIVLSCSLAMLATVAADEPWWSFQSLAPGVAGQAIDDHIDAVLRERNLRPMPRADARTLMRRLSFDLTGLPPEPDALDAFVNAYRENPETAYASLVDQLLASPHYGERWARHWLDVVHYGDTHGYDKDQARPHAWPYRDYVIRAFNSDRPYARFVQEQLAGDVLFPGSPDGIEALGFIAAGPWDLIGHVEVAEDRTDGKIARHLDRDDMVANTMSTFVSLTVHCAQCHDHKFDPIPASEYYGLQAVFAALDRADRMYDPDPETAGRRRTLEDALRHARTKADAMQRLAGARAGEAMAAIDGMLAAARSPSSSLSAHRGYHSAIEAEPAQEKWVQLDLGTSREVGAVLLHPCHDDFNGIGDGFGFPVRYRVEASDDPAFSIGVTVVADCSMTDQTNPGIRAVSHQTKVRARYVRVTATRLAARQDDFIFALAEISVLDAEGGPAASAMLVTAKDSIEGPPSWRRDNVVDGWYPGIDEKVLSRQRRGTLEKLESARKSVVAAVLGDDLAAEAEDASRKVAELEAGLAALPPPSRVYAGTIHHGTGAFAGTGSRDGKPRPIHVLSRGNVNRPGEEALPGALTAIQQLPAQFALQADAPEGRRRAALAHWITSPDNPLTWRSIVNRVWQYHFGRGLVDTPNDFGRMGSRPSHPALLDWLAADFRDSGGSLKRLHRLIVGSEAYRRSSADHDANAKQDPANRFLWRMNRRRLEAEAMRDSLLTVSGLLDRRMGGPAFQDFVILHPEHSPHYEYHLADLNDTRLHRRSIYRFLVRSKPQPWMTTMDCADPSMLVERRNETITPLQALALMNNQLALLAAQKFAERIEREAGPPEERLQRAFALALGRSATPGEMTVLAGKSLSEVCRALLNLNEFVFVD